MPNDINNNGIKKQRLTQLTLDQYQKAKVPQNCDHIANDNNTN